MTKLFPFRQRGFPWFWICLPAVGDFLSVLKLRVLIRLVMKCFPKQSRHRRKRNERTSLRKFSGIPGTPPRLNAHWMHTGGAMPCGQGLSTVHHYGEKSWSGVVSQFLLENKALEDELNGKKSLEKVPVRLPSGLALSLSAGEHNDLPKAIIEQFLPLYGFEAQVLYIGDTSKKFLFVDREKLQELHFF